MKATFHVLIENQQPHVKIQHKGEVLEFTVSAFGRKKFAMNYDVAEYINLYWQDQDERVQDKIFEIYREIKEGFDNIYNKNELFEHLSNKIFELTEFHQLDVMQNWLGFKNIITIPADLKIEYVEDINSNSTREKTFTRGDYFKLVVLSLYLKIMIPIWGEYISSVRQETGTDFKEFFAFQLLNKTNILDSEAIHKLKVYIEGMVGKDKFNNVSILSGISSEDYEPWLLSLLCVRQLCTSDISGRDSDSDLMKAVYKFVIQKIRGNSGEHESTIKAKVHDDNAKGENKISTLERYKVKTNISLGEIVELEFSVRDPHNIAQRLNYRYDRELLEESLVTAQELNREKLADPQMMLLRWIMKPVISPRGIMYLPKTTVINLLAVAQTVLMGSKHAYIGLLMTSYPMISEREVVLSPVDPRMQIPQDIQEKLDHLYPYRKPLNKRGGPKDINPVNESLDILTSKLSVHSWKSSLNVNRIEEVLGQKNKRILIRSDIKIKLAELVLDLGNL